MMTPNEQAALSRMTELAIRAFRDDRSPVETHLVGEQFIQEWDSALRITQLHTVALFAAIVAKSLVNAGVSDEEITAELAFNDLEADLGWDAS